MLFPLTCILLCYLLFVREPFISGYYTIHYLFDYSHGFVARGLVGAVITHFFPQPTPELLSGVVRVFDVLLILISGLCMSRALIRVKDDEKAFFLVAFLCLMLCLSAATYRYFFHDIKLDKLLWAMTFCAVLLVENKVTAALVPPICIAATLCNPVFLFFGNILVSILLLQKVKDNNNAKWNIAVCALAYLGMIAIGVYGFSVDNQLGFADAKELLDYYFAKYPDKSYLADLDRWAEEWMFEYNSDVITIIRTCFRVYFIEWGNGKYGAVNTLFCAGPVGAVITWFWWRVFKTESDRFQKFIFFLCLIAPVVTIPPILFSWETTKYFSYIFIVQAALFLYYFTHHNASVRQTVEWFYGKMTGNPVLFTALGGYLSCVVLFKGILI